MGKLTLKEVGDSYSISKPKVEAGQIRTDGQGFVGLVIYTGDVISMSQDSEHRYSIVILGEDDYDSVSFGLDNPSNSLSADDVVAELPYLLNAELRYQFGESND